MVVWEVLDCFLYFQHCFICRLVLGLSPGLLRLWHWQTFALITRLDHIHSQLDFVNFSFRSRQLLGWISTAARLHLIHYSARSDPFCRCPETGAQCLCWFKYGIYTSNSTSLRKQPEREGHQRATECRLPLQQAIFIRTWKFWIGFLSCMFFGRYAVAIYWI